MVYEHVWVATVKIRYSSCEAIFGCMESETEKIDEKDVYIE